MQNLRRLAERQHGLVTRTQLLGLGLKAGAIAARLKSSRLIRVHRGVYAVGHRRTDPPAVIMAALLACGEGAVASHSSAAFLWGLAKRLELPPEITTAGNRRRPGLRVHLSRTLARHDVYVIDRLRVTSPARTILDIAPRLDDHALARAVNEARNRCGMSLRSLADVLQRSPTAAGAARLKAFAGVDTGATRSVLADRFQALARRYGLPDHEVNARRNHATVDVLFPQQRLIVELDGRGWHDDPHAFEADRKRDAAALATGYATVRITHRRLTEEPEAVIAQLRRILSARQAGPATP